MTGIIQEMRKVVADVIGDDQKSSEVVHALMQRFGGERLYLPHNDYEHRNREIRELHQNGVSQEHLAKRYRLSIKTVYRIIGG